MILLVEFSSVPRTHFISFRNTRRILIRQRGSFKERIKTSFFFSSDAGETGPAPFLALASVAHTQTRAHVHRSLKSTCNSQLSLLPDEYKWPEHRRWPQIPHTQHSHKWLRLRPSSEWFLPTLIPTPPLSSLAMIFLEFLISPHNPYGPW